MQDNKAQSLMKGHALINIDSIVFLQGENCYLKSRAVFYIAKDLDGWAHYLYYFKYIPRFFSDFLYTFIAKHRYKVFGKKQACLLIDKKIKDRLI